VVGKYLYTALFYSIATTQPTTQNNLKPGPITIRTVLGNLESLFSVYNFILTQLDEIWKTTSKCLKMEDDLVFRIEDNLNFVLGNLES
jgi:hypothetical protein